MKISSVRRTNDQYRVFSRQHPDFVPKRGEVVRSRTTVLQAHTPQWLATYGNPGNGEYRAELRRAVAVIRESLNVYHHPPERVLLRLDGQYGTGAVLADLAGLGSVMRGKDYQILKGAQIQIRLNFPPDHPLQHPESGVCRALYDCPDVPVGPEQKPCRVVIATHPASARKSRVGVTRDGGVYELFFTNLPQSAFTATDVVGLYLHRGAFENALAPAGQKLSAHERRREADGSLRVVDAASIRRCRPCPLREQCQWQGKATTKPRQVSVLLHPLTVGAAPLLWGDWSRRRHRRACMQLLPGQRLEVQMAPPLSADPDSPASPLSRMQRAQYRLDWSERLARNARVPTTNGVTIRLFGVPEDFAISLGMATA